MSVVTRFLKGAAANKKHRIKESRGEKRKADYFEELKFQSFFNAFATVQFFDSLI